MMTKNQIMAKVLFANKLVTESQIQEYWNKVDASHDLGQLLLAAGKIDQKTYQVVLQYVQQLESKMQAKEDAKPAPVSSETARKSVSPAPQTEEKPLAIEGNNPYGQTASADVQIEKVAGLESTSIAPVLMTSAAENETSEKQEDALPKSFEIENGEGNVSVPEQLDENCSLVQILAFARKYGATDVYLSPAAPIAMRICGVLGYVGDKACETSQLSAFLLEAKKGFSDGYEPVVGLDFSKLVVLPGAGRNRLTVTWNETVPSLAFRVFSADSVPLDSLYLPEFCKNFLNLRQGLVLIAGPSGSGRSTTLSAFGEAIAKSRSVLMVSIEKPIERVLANTNGITIQKEIGLHVSSGVSAIREAIHSGVQVILFDRLETIEELLALLHASSSGALVFVVSVGNSIHALLSRLLSVSGEKGFELANALSKELRGIVVQHLIPVIDNQGWVLAVEALQVSPSVADLIRRKDLTKLPSALASAGNQAVSLDDSLQNLVESGYIRGEDAWMRSVNRRRFAAYQPAISKKG